MELPVQVTFRNVDASAAVESRIREEAAKLESFFDRIISCRVVVEATKHHLNHGKIYSIRIDLTVPGDEIVVNFEPSLHNSAKKIGEERGAKSLEVEDVYKDIYVAIRDSFKTARRQLQEYVERQRPDVRAQKF